MSSKKNNNKKFKVYYFTGDYFSSDGEEQHSIIIEARDEAEAEHLFKNLYRSPNVSFGWVERVKR